MGSKYSGSPNALITVGEKLQPFRLHRDKECLVKGAPWEEGFKNGLRKSKRVIALISENALQGLVEQACENQDNVLQGLYQLLGYLAVLAGK